MTLPAGGGGASSWETTATSKTLRPTWAAEVAQDGETAQGSGLSFCL